MIIIIPGFFISMTTFPGVVLHEMAHKFFCDLYDVPVLEANYFNMDSYDTDEPVGYVRHLPTNQRDCAIIGLAPLLINSIVCILLVCPYIAPFVTGTSFASSYSFFDFFLIWVGYSCGYNALPSKSDIAYIDKNVPRKFIVLKKIIGFFNFFESMGHLLWTTLLLLLPFYLSYTFFYLIPILLIALFFKMARSFLKRRRDKDLSIT